MDLEQAMRSFTVFSASGAFVALSVVWTRTTRALSRNLYSSVSTRRASSSSKVFSDAQRRMTSDPAIPTRDQTTHRRTHEAFKNLMDEISVRSKSLHQTEMEWLRDQPLARTVQYFCRSNRAMSL